MSAAVSHDIYPFEGRTFDRGGGVRMHYLDEGPRDAEPIVMLHGNPTWSIYYRSLVLALRDRYRCIVPDHVGCGLSDKPGDDRYRYTLATRVADVGALIEHLGLGDVSLAVHDWGGMIGMAWAADHAARVRRLVVMNTAAFHLPPKKAFPWPLRLTRTPLGAVLVRGGNAFAAVAARVCTTEKPMSRELRRAYVAPYASWDERIATLRFVEDIPLDPRDPAYDVVTRTATRLDLFARTPTFIAWGLADFVFDGHFLETWERRFPHAEVHRFERAGHYVLEDRADSIVPLVRDFLARTSAAPPG